MVKIILKNIKPYLASQLCSRVSTVEELVKLGHQLEKDYVQQVQYEGHKDFKPPPTMPQRPISSQPVEKPQVHAGGVKVPIHLEIALTLCLLPTSRLFSSVPP